MGVDNRVGACPTELLDQLDAFAKAATPPPWEVGCDPTDDAATLRARPCQQDGHTEPPVDVVIPFGRAFSDARYIAAACNAVPLLITTIRTLRVELTGLYSELREQVMRACDADERLQSLTKVCPICQVEFSAANVHDWKMAAKRAEAEVTALRAEVERLKGELNAEGAAVAEFRRRLDIAEATIAGDVAR